MSPFLPLRLVGAVAATALVCTLAIALSHSASARAATGAPVPAEARGFTAIEGVPLDLSQFAGRPVLVVNTASRCGFTGQYEGLQQLQDRYGSERLAVLAVPSDSFNQELGSAEEVAEFCALNYDLTLPMTDITPVRGAGAHPFYAWLAETEGFVPRWNFTKVLLDGEGRFVTHFETSTKPMSRRITREIDALLGQ